MKPLQRMRLLPAIAAAVFVLVATATRAESAGPDRVWEPALGREQSALFSTGDQGSPSTYDTLLLSLGRSVYTQLQRAREAALHKQVTNLRVALREARDTLRRLRLPAQLTALADELQVIRNDLADTSKPADADLWVPVAAQIDEVLVYAPEEVRVKTRQAVAEGRAAAGKGDRGSASAQLDVVTSVLQYSLGIFPLHKVTLDLDSAWLTANLPQPDWAGTLEAVQSALAAFHWYTRDAAHGLLAAYSKLVSAYVLAGGPTVRPDQKQQVLDYLVAADRILRQTPGGGPLAEQTSQLIDRVDRQASDIRTLLGAIQSQIRRDSQRAEDQYWDAVGRHPSP